MMDPWFITGFCDGEGAFTYSRSGKSISLYFAIKLNEEDKALVDRIFSFFNVGRIYKVKARESRNKSGNTKPAIYYRVTKVSELAQIIQHFDKYPLQSKKARIYNIWKEMWLLKKRFRRPDLNRLNTLARELSELSSKNSPIKRMIHGKSNSNL